MNAIKPRIVDNPKWTAKHRKDGKAITDRVEKLGKLNTRLDTARGARDRWALIELSYEYINIGCPRIAKGIVKEAEGL